MLRASEDAASRAATERLTRAESAERAAAVRQKRLARLGKIMTKKEAELARDPTFVAHHALLQARRRTTTRISCGHESHDRVAVEPNGVAAGP